MIQTRHPYATSARATMQRTHRPPIVDTLDLHGYRKADAIRRLTDFLDRVSSRQPRQTSCWVCVVTGSGAHSQDGPILRNTVESLLIKRKMIYMRDKGSFTVDAKSGIVLYDSGPCTDTKLQMAPQDPAKDVKLVGRPVAATINSRCDNDEYLIQHPLPKQVAQDDELLQRIKFESQREQRDKANENRQQKAAMKRVLSESQLEFERDFLLRQNEDEKLQKALLQSERDLPQEDAVLQDILAKSAADIALELEEEDRQLQDVLAKSADDLAKQLDEEERELQAILAKSMEDVVTVVEDDETALLSLSMDEQDELLIRAMEESLREM